MGLDQPKIDLGLGNVDRRDGMEPDFDPPAEVRGPPCHGDRTAFATGDGYPDSDIAGRRIGSGGPTGSLYRLDPILCGIPISTGCPWPIVVSPAW